MKLTWRYLGGEERDTAWNRVSSTCRQATFFHTKVWSSALEETFPRWVAHPVAIEFSDGNLMVMPLMRRRDRLFKSGYKESMLPGVYGGPLFLSSPGKAHWKEVWSAVNQFSNIIIWGNPYLKYLDSPKGEKRTLFTQALDLREGFDKVKKGFRKGHKANIKVARREGVEVDVAATLETVTAYYNIYRDSLRRWGRQAGGFYPGRLFYNLFRQPEYGRAIRLWVARWNGVVIGGALIFYHNEHAVYWHGVVHPAYMNLHAAHLLLSTAIEDACRSGFRWFDFNPSGGLKGVEHFKNGFGTRYLEFYSYRRLNPAGKAFRVYRYLQEHYLKQCSL